MLSILLPEAQPNKNIYKSFEEFIKSISINNWIVLYIFLELNFIKDLGYDPNLEKFKNSLFNDEIKKIKIDTFTYDVPYFLISKKPSDKIPNYLIKKSLFFTRSLFQNKFFIPNNLPFPNSRILLENYFS